MCGRHVTAAAEPAVDAVLRNGGFQRIDAVVEQPKHVLRRVEADLSGEPRPAALVAQDRHAAVAAAGAPSGVVCLQHHARNPAALQVMRDRQSGEAAADDRDVGIDGLRQ